MKYDPTIANAWNAYNQYVSAILTGNKRAEAYWYKRTLDKLEKAIHHLATRKPTKK